MKSTGPSWWSLLAFGLTVRLAVFGLGWLAFQHWPPLPWQETSPTATLATDHGLQIWYRWDAVNYLNISVKGYEYTPGTYCTAAFMPLLPAIMALLDYKNLIDPMITGFAVPNLAFILGMAFFGKYAAIAARDETVAWKACGLLAAYPTAFFFGCPYQESLGFLCVSMALWAWESKKTATTTAAVFVGTFARLTTLAVPGALLIDWFINTLRRRATASFGSIILVLVAGLVSVALFFLYMHYAVGDAMAHMKAHEAWNRKPPHPKNIVRTFMYLYYYYPEKGLWAQVVPEAISLFVFITLGLRALFVRSVFSGMLILLPILQALMTGTPLSLERIVLASFPAFIDAGQLLKRPGLFWSILGLSIILQLLLLNGYIHYQFVG
ncbi:hypothetical protein BH11PLA2_BH11PLA2_20250 [soil metagenome]